MNTTDTQPPDSKPDAAPALEASDRWMSVELLRWQYREVPALNDKRDPHIPSALRAMANAIERQDGDNFPSPLSVKSLLRYAANMIARDATLIARAPDLLAENKRLREAAVAAEAWMSRPDCSLGGDFVESEETAIYGHVKTGPTDGQVALRLLRAAIAQAQEPQSTQDQ